jgi:hypothetical protein
VTDDEKEWERIKAMSADDIRKECEARGIDTSKTVGVVLDMVRDIKRVIDKRRIEMN